MQASSNNGATLEFRASPDDIQPDASETTQRGGVYSKLSTKVFTSLINLIFICVGLPSFEVAKAGQAVHELGVSGV
jgi:hypothetical protein